LLIGLLEIGDNGVAQGVLKRSGVELHAVCAAVEKCVGRGPDTPIELMLPTPRLKRVFDLAREEAAKLSHTYVGTEDLLLAILREGRGVGVRSLKMLDADLNRIAEEIRREIGST